MIIGRLTYMDVIYFYGACNEGTTLYRFYSVIIIHE